MKKLICFVVCVLMMITFASCGSGNNGAESETTAAETNAGGASTEAQTTQAPSLTFPLKDTVTLKIMTTYNATQPAPNNAMECIKIMKDLTNVAIEWETVPSEGYTEAVSTRLAAGVNLPDVVYVPDEAKANQLVRDQIIVPINDYINKDCPDMAKFLDENPADKAMYVFPDGNMYIIGNWNNPTHITFGYLINQVGLKKLGLNTPETIDDLYDALVKFKADGMAQPWAPIWGQEKVLASAWGVHLHPATGAADFWAYDGKVAYEWTNPKLKDYFAWANKCYKEGLMDKEYATQSWDTITAKIAKGDVGFMDIQVGCGGSFNEIASKTETATFVPMPPVKGPNGDRFILKMWASTNPAGFAVTKECKNPDVATKFLSWCLLSQENSDMMYWGIEGKTFLVKDGKKVRPEGYTQDDLGKIYPMNALPYNQFWSQLEQIWAVSGQDAIVKADDQVQPYFIDGYPRNLLTQDEGSVWAEKMADITTYVTENKQKFISGEKPLSDWDSYVEGLKALGIDEVLKIEQARYDRYLQSTK